MSVVQTVDGLAQGPALVFGSLPPEGRDLDLLVRPAEQRALATRLAQSGFVRDGKLFVSFENCSASVVELVPAADWGLPEPELEELFARALPLEGFSNLRQPAPAHALEENARRCRLYREEAAGMGVRRIDGERPREELCAQLATEVWELLRRSR